jgi:hypothetical protein
MRLSLDVRDLLVASWLTDAGSVARTLGRGVEPAELDGQHLVSAVVFRCVGGRLGRLPAPRFAVLGICVYVELEGAPAAYLLDIRVTPPGKLLGWYLPVRTTRVRSRRGRAEGLGLRIRYGIDGPADPGALASLGRTLLPAGRLKELPLRLGPLAWRRGELLEAPGLDPILALGFDVGPPAELLYAEQAGLVAELPAHPVETALS